MNRSASSYVNSSSSFLSEIGLGGEAKAIITLSILLFAFTVYSQPKPDLIRGKELFKTNCSACHGVKNKIVGPPLGESSPEMLKRGREFVLNFVHNSQKLINEKDSTAVKIYDKYGKIAMPSFPSITEKDLFDIRSYLDEAEKTEPDPAPAASQPTADTHTASSADNKEVSLPAPIPSWFYPIIILMGVLVFVLIVFIVVIVYFNSITQQIILDFKNKNSNA